MSCRGNMDNSDETQDIVEADPPPPPKPTLIDKLKAKRWTFKVKNNLSDYVTVEPLICFYLLQIFVVSLIEPYYFNKTCDSLDHNKDAYFCDVITIHENDAIYQLCAKYKEYDINCKGFTYKIANISCTDCIKEYEDNNKTKVFVKPEDYRFCKVIERTVNEVESVAGPDSLVGVSAIILTFLVVMIISIWSDKHSKRKLCLLLPIFGQLLISIINLHGAVSNFLSLEFIRNSSKFVESLSGGMPLFLFGCFSYMNNDAVRHTLLFRFGIMCLIMTIYRYIPGLYTFMYRYYHNDDSYKNLISLSLVLNILCLLYVKIILNESKQNIATNALDDSDGSTTRSVHSTDNDKVDKVRKHSKRKEMAKVFSLDVVWDYILIIFKKRIQSRRLIIILFLVIVLVGKISPYDNRFTIVINGNYEIDIVDVDGGIFVIISILMFVINISDVAIAILVIGIPTAARLVMLLLNDYASGVELGEIDWLAYDFYAPFKRIASCSLLLSYVNQNESRIFLIVQAIAHLPKVVFQLLSDDEYGDIFDVVLKYNNGDVSEWFSMVIFYFLPILVFCGLGLLYAIGKNIEKCETEQMAPQPEEIITENPWTFINPNFHNTDEIGKDELMKSAPNFKESEYSTHL